MCPETLTGQAPANEAATRYPRNMTVLALDALQIPKRPQDSSVDACMMA